ncbi:acetyltransferase pyr8 [Aspergillus ibericus CBS 121593]|uniref:Wax synthase domain-containing protein n=1 Tax=Aspergillus ibericus CBS 121593 TaxID=1448316 RepID=A0A395GPS5_9EURO|nr:hypothetical protein BO80DRAFT_414501 [Aspergillus ibericus CBS 121593]RAK97495.1 hypothetical protein BO80DRAFT_414501 [Aspergillus ibericus CBS 121593]
MALSPDLLCNLVVLLQSSIALILLVRTPKGSILRWICLPSLVYMAYLEGVLVRISNHNVFAKVTVSGMPFTTIIQLINLLLVTSIDLTEHPGSTKDKLVFAFSILQSLRGIGTKWQARNVPQQPLVLRRNPPSRAQYIQRQIAIIIWEALSLIWVLMLFVPHVKPDHDGIYLYGPGREFSYADSSVEQLLARAKVAFVLGFPGSMLFLDSSYRMGSILAIGTGISKVESWPPVFGSLRESYTVRGFWGKFWHQYLRWPYTSISTAITCRILRLPKPSLLERYLNLTIVFALSATMHVVTNVVSGIEGGNTGTMIFFLSQAGAIAFEDTIQHCWAVLQREKANAAETPLWQRCVGFIWVFCWLAATYPWWWYPIIRSLGAYDWSEMLDVIHGLGLTKSNLSPMVVGGGIFLRIAFGAEI